MSLLVYLFTIAMGLVFGVLAMKNAELYWTQEYYDYACKVVEEQKVADVQDNQDHPSTQEDKTTLC